MKNKYLITLLVILISFSGCKDLLEDENLYGFNDEGFYTTQKNIQAAIPAVYALLPSHVNNFWQNDHLMADILSDDMFAGGGTGDTWAIQLDKCFTANENAYHGFYSGCYFGIHRANMILNSIDEAEYESETVRNNDKAEMLFLRAFFSFRISKYFGPGVLRSELSTDLRPTSAKEEWYGRIGADLKMAISLFEETPFPSIPASRLGHANIWAAKSLLGRIFLFYTGYYEQNDMPVTEGSNITSSEIVGMLDDVVENSGHKLLSDQRNNWAYAWDQYELSGYEYAEVNNLKWAGQEGDNTETVFQIIYNRNSGWGAVRNTNAFVVYTSPRGQFGRPTIQGGWGLGAINPQLWDSFEEGDLRRSGSIINVNDTLEGAYPERYNWGTWGHQEETGLIQKKFMHVHITEENGKQHGMFQYLYGGVDNYMMNNQHDHPVIRLADVMLMAAELGSSNAQSYLDQIRERAGLGPVPVNLNNIKTERRHELCLEGHRWFDLLRWHDIEAAVAAVKDVDVFNATVPAKYSQVYRSETKGLLPIPETETQVSGGLIPQNPGW